MTIRSVPLGPFTCFADAETRPGIEILENGFNYEKHVVAELRKFIPTSAGFADIGANIGIHTLIAKTINPNVPILCAECSPSNLDLLLRNVTFNKLTSVTVLPFALANHPRILRTNNCEANMCCSLSGQSDSEDYPRLAAALSLDAIISRYVDLVKLDVEGFEIQVLTGASELMKSRPRIIFEFCPQITHRSGVTPIEMLNFFFSRNYKLTMLDYQPGARKECEDASDVMSHLAATSVWITDILAEPKELNQ